MAKDREGVFHPRKGKPSGRGQKKGDIQPNPEKIEEQNRIEEEYGIDEEKLEVAGVHTRHPNRNEDKDRDRNQPDSRRRSVAATIMDSNDIRKEQNGNNQSLNTQSYFYVLLLSKKQAKLFRGDQSGFGEIKVNEMPNGVSDVVHIEEKEGQNLFRTGSSGGGSGAAYHGTGSTAPDDKQNTFMYLKEVDRTLWKEVLNKEKAPLILGGVDYIVAMYRDLSQYKNITEESLSGNLDNEELQKIYKKAKELVNPFIA
ncbi:MAG TPA: hypothetical protein VFE50_24885 [Cyclobacteriaceae bacterium]|nr:hypothetical protein [Cyclobacteriaceae bacterium]